MLWPNIGKNSRLVPRAQYCSMHCYFFVGLEGLILCEREQEKDTKCALAMCSKTNPTL